MTTTTMTKTMASPKQPPKFLLSLTSFIFFALLPRLRFCGSLGRMVISETKPGGRTEGAHLQHSSCVEQQFIREANRLESVRLMLRNQVCDARDHGTDFQLESSFVFRGFCFCFERNFHCICDVHVGVASLLEGAGEEGLNKIKVLRQNA